MASDMTANADRNGRRAAVVWLALLPAVDVLLTWAYMAAPTDRFANWQSVMLALVAQIAFWIGAFLFTWALRRFLSRLAVSPLLSLIHI